MVKERFDRLDTPFDELVEKMRVTNQHFAGLEHEARLNTSRYGGRRKT